LILFDIALHQRYHNASEQGCDFDMRTILDGSLESATPESVVTLVVSHDTQPL
jgi:alpha-amylase